MGLITAADAAELSPIHGADDRREVSQIEEARWRKAADATVAIFDQSKVSVDPLQGLAHLKLRPYGEAEYLCRDEPFYEQLRGSDCAGVLVAPDLILTAGHCLSQGVASCLRANVVFGFATGADGKFGGTVPSGEVYACREIVAMKNERMNADYALIRLDRAVPNHEPVGVSETGVIRKGTPLVMIGHPMGLPAKIAGGAKVLATENGTIGGWLRKDYFRASLDAYMGSSGSPVFNADTGLLEGVLVRGQMDFQSRRGEGCLESVKCDWIKCWGESVTKMSAILPDLLKATH